MIWSVLLSMPFCPCLVKKYFHFLKCRIIGFDLHLLPMSEEKLRLSSLLFLYSHRAKIWLSKTNKWPRLCILINNGILILVQQSLPAVYACPSQSQCILGLQEKYSLHNTLTMYVLAPFRTIFGKKSHFSIKPYAVAGS